MMMIAVLFLGVALFVFFYLVGSLFLHLKVSKQAGVLQHVLNFWVGLLLVVSVFALVKASFVSILILLPFILLSFKKYLVVDSDSADISIVRFLSYSVGLYVFLFFLQVNFNFGFLHDPFAYISYIHPPEDERYIYSTIISLLHYSGVETISPESVLKGSSGVSLYHFVEFWLASLFKTVYNVKSDLVLFYFIYPVFKVFTVLAACSVFASFFKRETSKAKWFIIGGVLFCFVVLGIKFVFPPVYKMALRDILFLPMLVLVCKAIQGKRYELAIALLMIASVENVLFMPALALFYISFYSTYSRNSLLKGVGFFLLYLGFFYVFKEKTQDKYFSLGLSEAFFSVFTVDKVRFTYRVLLLGALSVSMRLLLGYLFVSNYPTLKLKGFVFSLGYWFLLILIAYLLAFGLIHDLSIDANQLEILAYILVNVSFFFLLYYFLERKQIVVCIVLLLLLSDYSSPLARVNVATNYDHELQRKIEEVGEGRVLRGLYVDESLVLKDQWYLKFYPTYVNGYARANDYRMFLFNYDVTTFKNSIAQVPLIYQPVLNKIVQPLFPVDKPIIENIKEYRISIVWVKKDSKYLSDFKDEKPMHELADFYVYSF
ncbi:hypothetical protein [Rufibacter soli]